MLTLCVLFLTFASQSFKTNAAEDSQGGEKANENETTRKSLQFPCNGLDTEVENQNDEKLNFL